MYSGTYAGAMLAATYALVIVVRDLVIVPGSFRSFSDLFKHHAGISRGKILSSDSPISSDSQQLTEIVLVAQLSRTFFRTF